ncbi:MAG: hypothetical protein COW24_00150 [Candidatus Kerfeldbacteria bacterium CG15_BIG_FIL_POST_REV_8_21_14_020_45_12]|uniref:Thioredoxin-like fold domain-containing protein n=1 Tax=Candidatus Kerfeldbacteria bacterium CG15_BIG_FIL_POST_REV_8_21_14_020_45_12 TaxID=2014247 RepID=A0A2M7H5C8_9BACT|nr:MAG: hypothetical protein COW24_00150 [Candidatus Kerfeldbacteria bacterium CG15_BIG_FIL_POST_REV_8_21_14_020_45_12]PJA92898.1 MAG: hypothetical protein CO132_05900 [Candidatus Kerfeldbacteria bacterium CG_4_9_14_3_um_filter_45_8]
MAKPSSHSRSFFFLGLLAIASLIIIGSFFRQLFNDNFPKLNTVSKDNSIIVPTTERVSDPLVTVVPKNENPSPLPISSDPVIGAKNPLVTIVEFGDFECSDCASVSENLYQILSDYPDTVQLVWKDYPLPKQHLYSEISAQAARCAQEQDSFWEYHDVLLLSQAQFSDEPWSTFAEELGLNVGDFDNCLQSESTKSMVLEGYFLARSLGLQVVPTLYIGDQVIAGNVGVEDIKRIIDEKISEN